MEFVNPEPDFPTTSKAFARSMGGRQKAAAALDMPVSSFNQWCDGRSAPPSEKIVTLAMERVLEMSAAQRSASARHAIKARWAKRELLSTDISSAPVE